MRTSIKVIKQRVVGNQLHPPETDFLAIEDPLEIILTYSHESEISETQLMVTMRTPGSDTEMLHGFLYCEGLIQKASDITRIEFSNPNNKGAAIRANVHISSELNILEQLNASKRNFSVHSSCGVCGKHSLKHLELAKTLKIDDPVAVAVSSIHALPQMMQERQKTFDLTGGLHAAAIFSAEGELQSSYEDIGRHNALDKAIGANLIAGLTPGKGQLVCVSGRMSYEIIQKTLLAHIPILCGVGAPSSLAVALANDFNITLVGFLKNGKYNIYSCPERIQMIES